MFHRRLVLPASLLFVCLVQCRPATAQANCVTHSASLYCLPNSNSLFGLPTDVSPFAPVFSAVGSQLDLLPTASPASGITLRFDPGAGVPVRTTESLGPILSERAETIGKGRLFLGFTFQRIGFDSIDGSDLKNLPLVFKVRLCNQSGCDPTDTVVATQNRIDLKVNKFTSIATYGLTSRIDLSVSVPVETVKLGLSRKTSKVLQGNPSVFPAPDFGEGESSGIGDVVARAKGTIFSGERFGLAAGVDVRFPTGDELNFLGSGAWGAKPFLAASYRARVSPHANFGYQWNGDSVLASKTVVGASSTPASGTSSKEQLPANVFYSVGFEVPTKKFTFSADFISFHVFDALRLSPANNFGQPTLAVTSGSFTTSDGSIGFKINPVAGLILTTNVDIKLDHNGLRHRLIPLFGIAYTF
jgi:hypothetical protein